MTNSNDKQELIVDIVPFEDVVQEGDEYTLGEYLPSRESPAIAVRQETLGSTMGSRISKQTLPRLNHLLTSEHTEATSTYRPVLLRLYEQIQSAQNLLSNPEFLDSIRRSAIAHEVVHARLNPSDSEYTAVIGSNANLMDSEYLPRKPFRRAVFGKESYEETRAYAAQLETVNSIDYDSNANGILVTLILDKSVYAFMPGFEKTLRNCENGRAETFETNILGGLALITGDTDLIEKIWNKQVSLEEIQQQVAESLNRALTTPSDFINQRTESVFLNSIDDRINRYASQAVQLSSNL